MLDSWFNKLIGFSFPLIAISACNNSGDVISISTSEIEITPYYTSSPSIIGSAGAEETTPTSLPSPTPTPYIYTIVEGDTLLVIAARFGLSLDELLAANPDVNPYLLSIGAELIIPQSAGEGGVASLGFPTPLPVTESKPRCYPTASGGVWCIWVVRNDHETPLEYLSAVVSLIDFRGIEVANQAALPPLNVLWPGNEIPLITFFEPPLPSWVEIRVKLITSLEVSGEDNRYLPARVENLQTQIAENGLSAIVGGTVWLHSIESSANEVWVAVVAYDAGGNVVGIRRWEGGQIQARGSTTFYTLIYSLGPPIARIEALVEARP